MANETNHPKEYKLYKRRFAILFTVVILNISNAAMWINYSPVATTVGNYYGVTPQKVNWFSMVFLIVTMPFAFFSTFIIDKVGLKVGIYLGAFLNCVGAIIRAIGTSGIFPNLDVQYGVSLTGQVISAMAQSFLLFIPTKVSQLWFPESQRAISTTVLAMSNPLGIVIAQGATPLIVNKNEENVPINNYVWMSLAIFGVISTLVCVTRAKPETPPSLSALRGEKERPPYFQQLKDVFTCLPYMLLLLALGCGLGIFNTIATLTQQLLCPLGYTDVFGGITNVVMVLMGFVGSAAMGIFVDKTKLFAEAIKTSFGLATFFLIFMLEFYLVPNQKAALIIFCGLFGFFGIGTYPIGLELSVEATFPVEETISTAFIFVSGQIQGIVAIVLVPALATEQDRSRENLSVCNSDSDPDPKNYSIPLMIIMTYMTIMVSIMILFMKTKYKRLEAEQLNKVNSKEGKTDVQLSNSAQPYVIRL